MTYESKRVDGKLMIGGEMWLDVSQCCSQLLDRQEVRRKAMLPEYSSGALELLDD